MKYRIRRNTKDDPYPGNGDWFSRSGEWVDYGQAAKFSSENALEKFAKKYGILIYGIF